MARPEAILIAGPTASGKSALALHLARRLGGIVVNADSMQVYRDLRIVSARPTEAETDGIPHLLFGTVDAATPYSVSRWLADAAEALADIAARRALPIVVGGTGLYFKALTQGLSDIPAVPDAVRAEVRAWAAGRPATELHAALDAVDPATAARLRPTDTQRIVRALEVLRATGRGLALYQGSRTSPLLAVERCAAVYLTLERADLHARIDARFDRMMAEGALEEVDRLRRRDLDPTLPAMRALGVPPLLKLLAGQIDREAAVAAAKLDTRRYVKRQDTFARHQLDGFRFVTPSDTVAMEAAYS